MLAFMASDILCHARSFVILTGLAIKEVRPVRTQGLCRGVYVFALREFIVPNGSFDEDFKQRDSIELAPAKVLLLIAIAKSQEL